MKEGQPPPPSPKRGVNNILALSSSGKRKIYFPPKKYIYISLSSPTLLPDEIPIYFLFITMRFVYLKYYRIIEIVKDSVFKALSYVIGFDLIASFARPPMSCFIKPCGITKEF